MKLYRIALLACFIPGCQPSPQSVTIAPPGTRSVEIKTLHSKDRQEEADRELIREWTGNEYGFEFSEVSWVHHPLEISSPEQDPDFVEMLKQTGQNPQQIIAKFEEANRTRYVEIQPVARDKMLFLILDGQVRQLSDPR